MSTPVQLEYKTAYIRRATPDDCVAVGENMRAIDKLECSGASPVDAVLKGLETDYLTFTIVSQDTDEPLACFGIGPATPNETNYIWLLTTDRLFDVTGLEFARASKAWVTFIVNLYGLPCVNYIHPENTTVKRWLQWCGATFSEPLSSGLIPFQITPTTT